MEEEDQCVKVALRIRPSSTSEIESGCTNVVHAYNSKCVKLDGKDEVFNFDYVMDPSTSQLTVYDHVVRPLLEKIWKGFNLTIMAYGQTGSGKTFTMEGGVKDEAHKGLLPRTIDSLFQHMESRKTEIDFKVSISYLEILNEEVRDLLADSEGKDIGGLKVREDSKNGIVVVGLRTVVVRNAEEVAAWIKRGCLNRATAGTHMNASSSRSHAICTLMVDQTTCSTGEYKFSKLNLVDLAGSERAKKSNTQGERFKEGVHINRGLLSLGNVISALTDTRNKSTKRHVPYRDSKLTRMLQDSLGGNSLTTMIACVSPVDVNFDETWNTLRYAQRARRIQNQAKINEDPENRELLELRQQVQMLQLQLIHSQRSPGTSHTMSSSVLQLQEKLERAYENIKEKDIELSEIRNAWNATFSDLHSSSEDLNSLQKLKSGAIEFNQQLMNRSEEEKSAHNHIPNDDCLFKAENMALAELESAISVKETMINALSEMNSEGMKNLQRQYESKISRLESQIQKMEDDRRAAARTSESSASGKDLNAKVKDFEAKIMELSMKMMKAKKEQKEYLRLQKLKASGDILISDLNEEVMGMKKQRKTLQVKLRKSTEAHRKETRAKDLQIVKLKRQDQRKHYQLTKLEAIHQKQQNVLKRKNEEVAAVQKRLRTIENHSKRKEKIHTEKFLSNLQRYLDANIALVRTRDKISEIIGERKSEVFQLQTETCIQKRNARKNSIKKLSSSITNMQRKVVDVEQTTLSCFKGLFQPQSLAAAGQQLKLAADYFVDINSYDSALIETLHRQLSDSQQEVIRYQEVVKTLQVDCGFTPELIQCTDEEKPKGDERDCIQESKVVYLSDMGFNSCDEESSESFDDDDSDYINTPAKAKSRPSSFKSRTGSSHSDFAALNNTKCLPAEIRGGNELRNEIDDLLGSSFTDICCECSGKCATRNCECRLQEIWCGESCSCKISKCMNRSNEKENNAHGELPRKGGASNHEIGSSKTVVKKKALFNR